MGIFGLTSRIEGLWGDLKAIIKKIYACIHAENFIFFQREVEYKRNTRCLNNFKKLEDFAQVISIVDIDNLLNKANLIDIDYEVLYDD